MFKFTSAPSTPARETELEDFCFSDFYKDLNGVRPRGSLYQMFVDMDTDELNKSIQNMQDEIMESINEEKMREEEAYKKFNKMMSDVMSTCNVDWKNALRFLLEAEGNKYTPLSFEVDLFLYDLGLSSDKRREVVLKYFD